MEKREGHPKIYVKNVTIYPAVFSRFPELLVTKTTTSQCTIMEWLEITFRRTGFPDALVTDNGPQFICREFTDSLRKRSIHHCTTPVYTLQEIGLVKVWKNSEAGDSS
ncbi:MAG: transposase family protein, partial [Gammaproteobacteria bacterium]|nr:transposase family protein [Gammaproteobacteria bacterium]